MNMKITILLLFLYGFAHAQSELIDTSGLPAPPEHGFNNALITYQKIHRIVISHFSSADTLTLALAEKVLECTFDDHGRLTYIKGCLHEATDPCMQEFNNRVHYKESGKIASAVSLHFEGGKYLYDSTQYTYNDSSGFLKESNRFVYVMNGSDKDTLHGSRFYRYKNHFLSSIELYGYVSALFPRVDFERDTHGQIIKTLDYDANGKLLLVNVISKNASGQEIANRTLENNALSEGDSMHWDKSGKLIEKRFFNADTITRFIKYKYDKAGHVVDEYDEPQHQEFGYITKYKYDKDARLLEVKKTTAVGKPIYRFTYSYDNSGKLIMEVQFDAENEVSSVYKYRYFR